MTDKATPRPWRWDVKYHEGASVRSRDIFLRGTTNGAQDDDCIFALRDDWANWIPFLESPNAALIVRAVNSHDTLVVACGIALDLMTPGNDPELGNKGPHAECVRRLRAALAAATEPNS
jgi:hypothetical protein